MKWLNDINIILGSASVRRQDLLRQMALDFRVMALDVPEMYPSDLAVQEVPVFLAKHKSQAYQPQKNELLITADTVVVFEDQIVHKPQNLTEAAVFLRKFSGKSQEVITGVCLRNAAQEKTFSVKTRVFFAALGQREIDYYLAAYPVLDKAGGYGIQDWIGLIGVQKIEGDFYNVMGLPTTALYHHLLQMYDL